MKTEEGDNGRRMMNYLLRSVGFLAHGSRAK
jgi:hypothetical protein